MMIRPVAPTRAIRPDLLRRLAGLVAIVAMIAPPTARADEADCSALAGRKVRWILPYSLSGGYGVHSQLIVPRLAKRLAADIAVDHVEGAGGILGVRAIAAADPDGLTIGLLNGTGTMLAAMASDKKTPNPLRDVTILARVGRMPRLIAVSAESPIKSVDDLVKLSDERPLIMPAGSVRSSSFASAALAAHLLGLDVEFVLGYKGTKKGTLAALRGEVDVISYSIEGLRDQIVAGEIRPILQLTSRRLIEQPGLRDVPLFGGEHGVCAQRAKALGRDVSQAREDATALEELIGAGMLVVAPPGLDADVAACLEDRILAMLTGDEYAAAAAKVKRSLDPANGAAARETLVKANARAHRFVPIIQKYISKVRE
jgi:tripartite-type tricarboxylate transporter receptor subunit TctC